MRYLIVFGLLSGCCGVGELGKRVDALETYMDDKFSVHDQQLESSFANGKHEGRRAILLEDRIERLEERIK